jgi:hypothetical protein
VKLQGIPYLSRRTQQIVQDPLAPRTLYAATTAGLWQTIDYGENWKRVTDPQSVVNTVLLMPGPKGTRILAGMESEGVLRSDDEANSFRASNAGFSHRVIASVAADPRDNLHLVARVEGFAGTLLETHDGGSNWTHFPGAAPARPLVNVYGTSSGWWASFADGGLAQYDAAKGKWIPAVFREPVPATSPLARRRKGASPISRKSPSRVVTPEVRALVESATELLVATSRGLWMAKRGQLEFSRVSGAQLPESVLFVSVIPSGVAVAMDRNTLWIDDFHAGKWRSVDIPAAGIQLLWALQVGTDQQTAILLGTQNGVFTGSASGRWRLLLNGLPAIPTEPLVISGPNWYVSAVNGGVYQSSDAGISWQRVDPDSVRGRATLLRGLGADLLIASQSEGMIRYTAADSDSHSGAIFKRFPRRVVQSEDAGLFSFGSVCPHLRELQ